ncbi:MAG: Xaa-Pro dipeptidase, partial [Acidobacteriota bacterium]
GEVPGVLESACGGGGMRWAFVGESAAAAETLGVEASLREPEALLAPLDWHRAAKTEYEIALTRVACEKAAKAHRRVSSLLGEGASELEIHRRFLEETGHLEHELPYDSIVALDEKSAILHYQNKRHPGPENPRVLLLDAGAEHRGYAADVTRTWTTRHAPATFRSIVAAVDAMERRLVSRVGPGRSYVEIHLECHRQTAEILTVHGVLRCSAEEAAEKRLTRPFMPHGVGHLIGLQVHEVGGHQSAPDGGTTPPPDEHVLRNTRTLEPGHLVTVEPGIYFIPMLLEGLRAGPHGDLVDWGLVEQMVPCGGVRIEDNVLCTQDGFEDLTRAHSEAG